MIQKKLMSVLLVFVSTCLFAQEVELQGEVFDEYLVPFKGAIVKTSTNKKTITDADGFFKIKTKLPVKITIKSDGHVTEIIQIEDKNEEISLILKESSGLDEVVISASRTPEKIFESPVSVSRLSLKNVKNTPSVNFYDGLENIRGISLYNGSLGFKVINTRGFTDMLNFRYIQLVDGIDNVYTSNNISFGNVFGVNDLDIESVEVLPGASSALYGANAFNGVLLMNTKSPFDYQGVSVNLKSGITKQSSGNNLFYNPSVRLAHKFNDKFAAKVNFSLYDGEDWHADDYRSISNGQIVNESRTSSTSYNGVNSYGDEQVENLKVFAYKQFLKADGAERLALAQKVAEYPNVFVSRTGYKEADLTDNRVKNKKFNFSLFYKPWGNDKLQIKWGSYFYKGDFFFQASPSRYTAKDTYFGQHLLEFKGESFYVRGYMTNTELNNYYNHISTSVYLNNKIKSPNDWFEEYAKAFIPSFKSGVSALESDVIARSIVDKNRLIPGTEPFNKEFNKITNTLSNKVGGSKGANTSSVYQIDANFDFSKYIDFSDIIIGGSYRSYETDSKGTIYTDKENDPIKLYEYGIYAQVKNNFFDDRLKLMGTLRYDGSKNFEANLSPRISANYILGRKRNHNFRVSYQTAFKNPTVQNQYLGVQIGPNSFVMGNIAENKKRFNKTTASGVVINDNFLKRAGFSKGSYSKFFGRGLSLFEQNYGVTDILGYVVKNNRILKPFDFNGKEVKPEKVTALELGYRGLFDISGSMFELDINSYYNKYKDLITERTALIPYEGNVYGNRVFVRSPVKDLSKDSFQLALADVTDGDFASITMPVNSDAVVTSYGFLSTIKTKFFENYDVSVTYNWSDYTFDKSKDESFVPSFNTPKHSLKLLLGNRKLFENFGFNIAYRWQSEYEWESLYGDGLIEARSVVDAQISYNIPYLKSRIKLGGNNIAGKEYSTAIGTPNLGSIYYLSWTIND